MVCEIGSCPLCASFDEADAALSDVACMRRRLFFSNSAMAVLSACAPAYVSSLERRQGLQEGWRGWDARKLDGREHSAGGFLCNPAEMHSRLCRRHGAEATGFINAHDGFHAQGHKCEE